MPLDDLSAACREGLRCGRFSNDPIQSAGDALFARLGPLGSANPFDVFALVAGA